MTFSAKTLCIGCTAAFLSGGPALAQEACKDYVVVAGDNLRFIARKAYGDGDLYRVIFNANVKTIGAKADLIEVGAVLTIPCDPRSESATETAAVAPSPSVGLQTGVIDPAKQPIEVVPQLPVVSAGSSAPAEAPEVPPTEVATAPEAPADVVVIAPEAAPEPEAVTDPVPAAATATQPTAFPYRIVTGNGYAPFADEMLPGGGMFTQLVEMAVFRADPAQTYSLTFISDWQAHIDALLPSGAYDVSFPWRRPDCEAPGGLTASDSSRCENFVFSAPFYETVDGFFAPAGSDLATATSYGAFEGKRICRPDGMTTGVLDAAGLTADKIDLMRPIEPIACFEALATGRVDLVSIDAEVGDSAIAELGLVGSFTQNPHLLTLDSLHAIAHKGNLRAVGLISMLDAGMVEMYESGEWYDIVSTALAQTVQD